LWLLADYCCLKILVFSLFSAVKVDILTYWYSNSTSGTLCILKNYASTETENLCLGNGEVCTILICRHIVFIACHVKIVFQVHRLISWLTLSIKDLVTLIYFTGCINVFLHLGCFTWFFSAVVNTIGNVIDFDDFVVLA